MHTSFAPDSVDARSSQREETYELFEPHREKRSRAGKKKRRRHRERIYARTRTAIYKWRRSFRESENDCMDFQGSILRHLPPAGSIGLPKASGERSSLPIPRREVAFKAGTLRSIRRLFVWISAGILFLLCVLWDWVNGRNTIQRRAMRLRETFERMGTTFVKVGQQLSMRLDLLPFVYTRELEKMLDNVPPFPVEVAIRTIERAAGKALNEVFSAFDPEPVGSASVGCVYQAILKNGKRVAVKVRRPGIARQLAADMRALRWIALAAEQLMFVPGFTANFVFELNTMLTEELDFVREARFSDLYRHRVRKTRNLRFVSAPRIFFDYSSEEVMVSEFVSGIWMKDLLPALESGNLETRRMLKELNIDPVILARRIQIIARFNNFENIFFHADLHPGNILVKPNNRIVLIDFGSCGSFSKKELNSWRRWFDAQSIDDVGGMVQAALAILEPLPPIDKDHFGLRLEYIFWNDLYALKSKHSHWSERVSSRLWMGFLNLSREFQVPLRLNTLRMIRASMLTDTIAARLDNHQDPYREFRRYERMAGSRAETRLTKRIHRLLGPGKFIRMEQGLDATMKFIYELQRTVDSVASIRMGAIIGRAEYFITLMLRGFAWACVSLGAMTAFFFVAHVLRFQGLLNFFGMGGHASITLVATARSVVLSNLWQMVVVAPLMFILWRVSFRLQERRPWDK